MEPRKNLDGGVLATRAVPIASMRPRQRTSETRVINDIKNGGEQMLQ
jgi:hypothetical protein